MDALLKEAYEIVLTTFDLNNYCLVSGNNKKARKKSREPIKDDVKLKNFKIHLSCKFNISTDTLDFTFAL